MEDIIKIFLEKTIPDMLSREYNLSYIKFLFSNEAICEMEKITDTELGKKSLLYLKNPTIKSDQDIYIKINDYKTFFNLLDNLIEEYSSREYKSLLDGVNFIRSIWIRMSASDIEDVNGFLKRQLDFLRYDNIIPYEPMVYKKYDDFDIVYENKCNDDWFETNNRIAISLKKENETDDLFASNYYYDLPSIHYAFNYENDDTVCYIYGVQNIENYRKDDVINEKMKLLRKKLYNKYVSPDFILSLRIFIDFLCENNITNIKVPLLQVYNYPYHVNLSNDVKQAYLSYTDDEKKEIENDFVTGKLTDKVFDYMHDKKMYDKFVNKADLISMNKTERLINTFIIMNERYDNIEFLSDPFIESDYLLIRAKEKTKSR